MYNRCAGSAVALTIFSNLMAMTPIPAIDLKDGRCVRLVQGRMDDETVYADDPVAVAERWASDGAARLHVVDLDGAVAGCPVHAEVVIEIIRAVRIPVQIGGGIRKTATVERYLAAGAASVIFGTAALQNLPWATEVIARFPGQVIIGIDAKAGRVATRGWTELHADGVVDVALRMASIGAAALIVTDIEKDGMLAGPSFDLYREVTQKVPLPVIASGGVATAAHLQALAAISGVTGAIIGRALYTGDLPFSAALLACRTAQSCEAKSC